MITVHVLNHRTTAKSTANVVLIVSVNAYTDMQKYIHKYCIYTTLTGIEYIRLSWQYDRVHFNNIMGNGMYHKFPVL